MIRDDLKFQSDAPTRPLLLEQIREALKNRQHIELKGSTIHVRKILDELTNSVHGQTFIPPAHEEDYMIRIIEGVSFPPSDKIIIEGVMRHLLLEFGWPSVSSISHVSFFFGKLLKELNNDRVIPAMLFVYPEMLRQKAYRILEMLGEYTIDRKMVGIPSILCLTEQYGHQSNPLYGSSFHVKLEGFGITAGEVIGIIEETCPGCSGVFDSTMIDHFADFHSKTHMQSKARELLAYMRKLGLEEVTYDLWEQMHNENKPEARKSKHAKAAH